MLSTPEATASSTPYWMIGLSTSGSISFGCALVAGRKRVPRPAAGNTALRMRLSTSPLPWMERHPAHRTSGVRRYGIGFSDHARPRLTCAIISKTCGPASATAAWTRMPNWSSSRRSRRAARLIPELEGLKREQNTAGDEVARAKRQGLDASAIFAANKARGQQIRQLEIQLDKVEQQRIRAADDAPEPAARERAGRAPPRQTTRKCGGTASRRRSTSSRGRTGRSVRRSASSTSSGRRRCPARASRCCWARAPGSRAR